MMKRMIVKRKNLRYIKPSFYALSYSIIAPEQELAIPKSAIQRAAAAEAKVTELQNAQAKVQSAATTSQADQSKLQAELQAAKNTIAQLQQRVTAAEIKAKAYDEMQARAQSQQAARDVAAAEQAKVLTTYTTTPNDTLGDLALKYYGHATEPYWRLIYEANKAAIGDNPNRLRQGTVLNIPVLPDNMKK